MTQYILALDQGTTSSRAMVIDHSGRVVAVAQQEFPQITPLPAHVLHDPDQIWETQLAVAKEALAKAGVAANQVAAIGVTNQRETTVIWDRETGKPLDHAVVWQSRITEPICESLRKDGYEELIRQRTGLLIDPYFSGTKIRYLLDRHEQAQGRAERGELLFGTIDSFLIWRLSGGTTHVTDVSNASRTMLFDIDRCEWDDELLKMLRIPRAMLPEVVSSSGVVAQTDPTWFGEPIPIAGIAGDQQAATFGQLCFEHGMAKNTYGTGCFFLLNTGNRPIASKHRLLTTVGWRIGGETTYCLEGAVFMGGAVIQWLRDGLGILECSEDSESMAQRVEDAGGVTFVPAFVGLGAPHWDPAARGLIIGLSRHVTADHIVRAALESMAWQTKDLVGAMQDDFGRPLTILRVDGGASRNDLLMQFQSDVLGVPVDRPENTETTALGAAYLAGLAVGYWPDQASLQQHWVRDRTFEPQWPQTRRDEAYRVWQRAVERSAGWAPSANDQP